MTEDTTQNEPPEESETPAARASFGDIINSMDSRAWRAIIMSAASVVIVLALLAAGRFYFGDEIEKFIDETLGQANRGHWGLVATILVFTLTAYVGAPQIVLIGACVVAFGPELGFWNATVATIVSGAATYFTGRLTSAETQKRFGGATGGRFTRFIGKNGFLASMIVRLVPAGPFVVVNMAFGAARVNFWAFILGLAIGSLPKTVLVAFAGDSILDALEGEFLAATVMAVLAIAVWIAIAFIVRRIIRRGDKDAKSAE
ncbi:MAG: TVP38/TMEM64 family protein [Hyphomonadaceae bacterium]|nr:TVP38/TMEM64 family protein [Hyphomonadaceae bacterium]MCA8885098.1 TVP38/TMEM64 family protein [Hyphomonadaceae bacterium]